MRDREGDKKIKRKREGDRDWERKKHKGKEKDRDKEKERWWRWKGQRKKESLSKLWEIENRTGQNRTRTLTRTRILKLDAQSCRWFKIHKYEQPMARTFAGILYILTKFCYLVIIALLYRRFLDVELFYWRYVDTYFFIVDAFKWIFVSLLMKNRF